MESLTVEKKHLEEICVRAAHPLGILTAVGCFKRLRHPKFRFGAFAFTAATQALWERDQQVQTRERLIVISGADGLRMYGPGGEVLPFEEREKVKLEAKHHLRHLYDSKAILEKSLIVGASLGTIPFIGRAIYLRHSMIEQQNFMDVWIILFSDYVVNDLYATRRGLSHFLNPSYSMQIALMKYCFDDLGTPSWRWYSRKGKHPSFNTT